MMLFNITLGNITHRNTKLAVTTQRHTHNVLQDEFVKFGEEPEEEDVKPRITIALEIPSLGVHKQLPPGTPTDEVDNASKREIFSRIANAKKPKST